MPDTPKTPPAPTADELEVLPAQDPAELTRTIEEMSRPGTPLTIIETDGTVTRFGR